MISFHKYFVGAPVKLLTGSVVKLCFSLLALKVIAFFAGPAGMAVIGQLQGFLQIASTITSSVGSNGVVKLLSDGKNKDSGLVLGTALRMLVVLSVFLLFVFAVSSFLWINMFQGDWLIVFLIIPVAAFFVALVNVMISYYNGLQNYTAVLKYGVIFSFLCSLVGLFFAFVFEGQGAISSVVISPISAGLLMCLLWQKENGSIIALLSFYSSAVLRQLRSFSFMALGSAVLFYGGQIYLRDYIQRTLSLEHAGLWYAATKLSDVYMGIFSALFVAIMLPKFSSCPAFLIKRYIRKATNVIVCLAALFGLSVYLFAEFVVLAVYGAEFLSASSLLALYVFGDCVKITSWVYLYYFMSRGLALIFLACEIVAAVLYVLFARLALDYNGFNYIPLGYLAQACLSFLIAYFAYSYYVRRDADF